MYPPDSNAPLQIRLVHIHESLTAWGFSSASELLIAQLERDDTRGRRETTNFFMDGRFAALIRCCLRQHAAGRVAGELIDDLIPIISKHMDRELDALCKALRKQLKTYTPDDIRSLEFETVGSLQKQHAPYFHRLLASLTSAGGHNSNTKEASRNKEVMLTFSIAHLCHIRTRRANLLQGHIGYFLVSTGTRKRCIEALHRLGLTVAFESLNKLQRSIADAARATYKSKSLQMPWIVSYDNMNYYANVKTLLLHKKPHMQNDTAAYVYFLHDAEKYGGLLPRTWVKHGRDEVKRLTTRDLLPPQGLQYYCSAAKASIFNILNKYCGEALAKSMKDHLSWGAAIAPELNVLKLQKSEIYTLPTLDLNEARVDETIEILEALMQELGVTPKQMHSKVAMFKGDWLTIRNMKYDL